VRFVLDEDVDAGVRRPLMDAGHDAWTIPAAALAGADDDVVSVYADEKGAVLITHDRQLADRRRHCFVSVIELRCNEPDAPDIVRHHLSAVIAMLTRQNDKVVVTVSPIGAWISGPAWMRTERPASE
jgi:predicted nuclease of predicted toxin-antitoxin system